MSRNYRALALMLVGMYGEEILKASWAKLVELANKCIDEDLVPYMDPIRPKEGIDVAAAIKAAVYADRKARAEADAAMPELIGPDKDVRWALELRARAIENARALRQRALQQKDELTAMRLDEYVAKKLRMEYCASWFIDNREEFTDFPTILKPKGSQVRPEDAPMGMAEAEAVEEMTIRPERAAHPGAVEIRAFGIGVMALYRYDQDFLRVVRSKRLRWNPDAQGWQGRIGSGSIADQIEELAEEFLRQGFAVMISDEEARARVRVYLAEGRAT